MNAILNRIKASCLLALGLIALLITLLLLTDRTFLRQISWITFSLFSFSGFFVFANTLAGFLAHPKESLKTTQNNPQTNNIWFQSLFR